MDTKADAMKPRDEAKGAQRQKYERPVMVAYGDIRTITRSVVSLGMGDGAMSGVAKT
jgi:hypothetical protein